MIWNDLKFRSCELTQLAEGENGSYQVQAYPKIGPIEW